MSTAANETKPEAATDEGLLPCPFDGGAPRRGKTRYGRPVLHWVVCDRCGACADSFNSPLSAKMAWNSRADSDALEVLRLIVGSDRYKSVFECTCSSLQGGKCFHCRALAAIDNTAAR